VIGASIGLKLTGIKEATAELSRYMADGRGILTFMP
jgi:hypothetical protein